MAVAAVGMGVSYGRCGGADARVHERTAERRDLLIPEQAVRARGGDGEGFDEAVAFGQIFSVRNDAHVLVNVQSTHNGTAQRHNVIDGVTNPGFLRQSISFSKNGMNCGLVDPFRSGPHAGGTLGRIFGRHFVRVVLAVHPTAFTFPRSVFGRLSVGTV